MTTLTTLLSEYGLEPVYHSHRLHGDYPLLNLSGTLKLDRLIDNIHFQDTAFLLGLLPELWAGEVVRFSTSSANVPLVEAVDGHLKELVEHHIHRVCLRIQQELPQIEAAQEAQAAAFMAEMEASEKALNALHDFDLDGDWIDCMGNNEARREAERQRVARMPQPADVTSEEGEWLSDLLIHHCAEAFQASEDLL